MPRGGGGGTRTWGNGNSGPSAADIAMQQRNAAAAAWEKAHAVATPPATPMQVVRLAEAPVALGKNSRQLASRPAYDLTP